jgi:hypothetical protein
MPLFLAFHEQKISLAGILLVCLVRWVVLQCFDSQLKVTKFPEIAYVYKLHETELHNIHAAYAHSPRL